ncbi:MAG: hypothetical protein ACLSCZ_11400 [Ruminococcus sp.]
MAISLEHKSITVDVNNRNAPNVVAIANVNDKAVRYLDVTLTASGNKLTFTGCTATATFATDGYLISDSVACTINSAADVITVPLENFKSMSGFLAIEIKIANGETQVLNTPLALKVKVTPSLLDKSMISKDSAGTTAEICREVATARGKYESLNARLNGIDSAVSNKAEKNTVSQLSARMQTAEKALTGKANATDVNNALKSKEDNSNKVNSKTDITDSSTNYPSIGYLNEYYYDTNETYSSEETDELLATKYDSSNIESGTSTLTPYSTVADKIKSASCTYKTIGDIVIVSATVKMNAVTIGASSTYLLIDLPYKCIAVDNVFCVGISNLGKIFKFAIPKNNTWLQFSTQDKTAYTFADGEQINVICLYKIK